LGYPAGFHRVTGALEVVAGLLLLVPATRWVGAIGSIVILEVPAHEAIVELLLPLK
jgi:hypothetical protein